MRLYQLVKTELLMIDPLSSELAERIDSLIKEEYGDIPSFTWKKKEEGKKAELERNKDPLSKLYLILDLVTIPAYNTACEMAFGRCSKCVFKFNDYPCSDIRSLSAQLLERICELLEEKEEEQFEKMDL